jgi:hypothetical protein
MIKNIFTAAILTLSAVSAFAFDGDYTVSGYDPYDKMDYTGSLSIIKDKNVYQAKWTIKEGGKQYKYVGTGLKIDDDTISFLFKDAAGVEEDGLQVYMRTDDQTLQGPFVLINKNLIGTETVKLR